MKKLFILIIIAAWAVNASAQSYQWAKSIGNTAADNGNSIATDASGNVYITGYFQATTDFGAEPKNTYEFISYF